MEPTFGAMGRGPFIPTPNGPNPSHGAPWAAPTLHRLDGTTADLLLTPPDLRAGSFRRATQDAFRPVAREGLGEDPPTNIGIVYGCFRK